MNKMKILVTYAGVWKMDNGQSGMTLNYFMYGENGEQMISRVDATGGPVGQQRAKCSLDPSMRQKITFVPGIYDATMGMKIGSDGKPVLTVEDLDFCSRVQIPDKGKDSGQEYMRVIKKDAHPAGFPSFLSDSLYWLCPVRQGSR